MSLDRLVERILDDAREHGARIVEAAMSRRLEFLDEAGEEAELAKARIIEGARREAEMERRQKVAAAVIQARVDLLQTKQTIIARVIERAVEAVLSAPKEEYMAILLSQLRRVRGYENAELILSGADRRRLGEELVEAANRDDGEAEGTGVIALSQSTRDIAGGFILRTGDREINCSLDARIESEREEIEEAVARIMFT